MNCKLKDSGYGIAASYDSYLDVHNCTFTNCAGLGLSYSDSTITNCIMDGNGVGGSGISMGGTSGNNVDIENCIIKKCMGDGISKASDSGSSLNLKNCYIGGCSSDGIEAAYGVVSVDHCLIEDNHNSSGIYSRYGQLNLTNSVIRDNYSSAVYLYHDSAATIKNNWIHRNGGGISFTNQGSVPIVRNNTIYNNGRYGLSLTNGATPDVMNCIIYGHTRGDFYGTFNTVNFCNLQYSYSGGTGNIFGDPGFMNVGTDPNDLHIDSGSQCKDAGNPNGNYTGETDIDDEGRVKYGRVDIGGDEYYWSPADYDEDGDVDLYDYALFAQAWHTQNADISLDGDSDVDMNDLRLFCADWLWEPAWTDSWMMCMGGDGGFDLESIDSDKLMITDVKLSMEAMPERIAQRTKKFYEITPEKTVSALRQALEIKEENIKEILKWLDEKWLSSELENLSKEEYLDIKNAIESSK